MGRGGTVTGSIVGLLVLVGCVVILVAQLQAKGLPYAASAAAIVGVLLALPPLAIPLVRRLRREQAPTADQVGQARETLAGLVTEQWRREALARSLGDPEPMPVRWRLTDRAVMDHPRLIMAGPLSFDGRSDRIGPLAAEFRRLRRRRLVIMGDPGSGKTTLAVQLLLELLNTRRAGEPIPVLVSLARWDPLEQPQLQGWLADRLAEDYPSLRAFGPDVARALSAQGKILPILDGLDELPLPQQARVIAALNTSLTETDQLVLTSRTPDYGSAIAEAQDVLTAAAVIEPEPLSSAQTADYLAACLPPDPGSSWAEVLDRLREGVAGHLATVLATPLGLWLLRTVYITPGADPASLLNSQATGAPTTLQADLFDKLIPAVLATRTASRDPADTFRPRRTWHPHEVRNALTYFAQHLHQAGTRDLLWWDLAHHTLTARYMRRVSGLVSGLTYGLGFGLGFGLEVGLVVGMTFGLVARLGSGLVARLRGDLEVEGLVVNEPAYANLQLKHRTKLLASKMTFGLTLGLGGGLAVGLMLGLGFGLVNVGAGLAIGLGSGLAIGLAVGFVEWVETPSRTDWATTPRSTYKAARSLAVLRTSVIGLVFGLGVGLVSGLVFGLDAGLVSGLAVGLVSVLADGLSSVAISPSGSSAWVSYALASRRLADSRKLPLRLMDFLDDAYRLGLLRTIGSAYQFRHAEFHDHLLQAGSARADCD